MAEEEIPSVITQTFINSDKETQNLANQYIIDVKNHDVPAAFEEIQELFRKASLTADQRAIVARALMTTSQKIQDAAATGDVRANDVLNAHIATK
jgi:hypothetical protein